MKKCKTKEIQSMMHEVEIRIQELEVKLANKTLVYNLICIAWFIQTSTIQLPISRF